jgi:phosphatidylinositol phospholipase C delta
MTTMMSPARAGHIHPVIQAGGGDATSVVPAQHLYLAQSIQDHLTRVYDSLRGNDPTLSREKLAGFLAVTQRQVVELPVREQYKFEEFLEIVWHSDGFEALKKKPISNYFISSSHNTYLLGNQLSSKSSTEAYKNVRLHPRSTR